MLGKTITECQKKLYSVNEETEYARLTKEKYMHSVTKGTEWTRSMKEPSDKVLTEWARSMKELGNQRLPSELGQRRKFARSPKEPSELGHHCKVELGRRRNRVNSVDTMMSSSVDEDNTKTWLSDNISRECFHH